MVFHKLGYKLGKCMLVYLGNVHCIIYILEMKELHQVISMASEVASQQLRFQHLVSLELEWGCASTNPKT